jgi:hypothetical protein
MDMVLIDNESLGDDVQPLVNYRCQFLVTFRKFLGKFFG